MAGRDFDEWQAGQRITHQPSRTVTETDNLLFSAMTHNMQPLHLDAETAKALRFSQGPKRSFGSDTQLSS
jgi:acyl dehydratase